MFQPVGPPASSVRLGTGLCFRWHLQVCITVTPANCCPADSGSRSFTAPDCPSQARCPMDCWILSWSGRCGGPAAICWCQHLLRSRPRDSDSHCHVTVPLWLQLKTNFCWPPGAAAHGLQDWTWMQRPTVENSRRGLGPLGQFTYPNLKILSSSTEFRPKLSDWLSQLGCFSGLYLEVRIECTISDKKRQPQCNLNWPQLCQWRKMAVIAGSCTDMQLPHCSDKD